MDIKNFSLTDIVVIGVFVAIISSLSIPLFIKESQNIDVKYAATKINTILDEIDVYRSARARLSTIGDLNLTIAPVILDKQVCLRVEYIDLTKIKFDINDTHQLCAMAWRASKHERTKDRIISKNLLYFF
ncbi:MULTISPECIES: hypothetical protein [unclassified Campylobacter]|uniref:hypothetical protein n=1 Tax=unclassified Campylobacter TaxID=2593542 RepID=UPI003D355EE8